MERHAIRFNRIPVRNVPRKPFCIHRSLFRSCELCYGKLDCCEALGDEYVTICVRKDFEDWNELEIKIWEYRQQGKFIRLVIDKDIPNSILWALSYSEHNLLQINVFVFDKFDSLQWVVLLSHAAERCGLFFIWMIYPIVPEFVKTYHVLRLIDTIRSLPYCRVMLRFAEFTNSKVCPSENYVNINGRAVSKSRIELGKSGRWVCTSEYTHKFLSIIQEYARGFNMDVQICGG